MKRFTFFLVVIVICSLSLSFAQDEQQVTVEKFLNEWAGSLQKGEADKMAGLYEDSNDVITIQSTGTVRKGIGEIRKEYESAFSEVIFKKAELENITIRHQGDLAWASCRLKAETTVRQYDAAWILEIYTSFVLKRADGQWRIVLEQSTPIADVPRVRPQ